MVPSIEWQTRRAIAQVLVSDGFGNVIAYEEMLGFEQNLGKKVLSLTVCDSSWTWTHPSGTRGVQVTPYLKGESYSLTVIPWDVHHPIDPLPYRFLN